MRNFGASVGLAMLGTLLISQNRSNIESRFEDLGATKSQADQVVDSLSQSGGGDASDQIQQADRRPQDFFHAVQQGFAESTEVIFYGMAIAMALAGIVALARIPKGKAPEAGDTGVTSCTSP